MRLDKLTIKSQEAIQEAQHLAEKYEHQQIEPEHLLLSILKQDSGIAAPLLKKPGADPGIIISRLESALQKLPKVTGATENFISQRTKKIIEAAFKEAQRHNDEYLFDGIVFAHSDTAFAPDAGGLVNESGLFLFPSDGPGRTCLEAESAFDAGIFLHPE